MELRSPVTPIPGLGAQARPDGHYERAHLVPAAGSPSVDGNESQARRRSNRAAMALLVAAGAIGADMIVRPVLAPDLLAHPVIQGVAAVAFVGTAYGVQRGWKSARRAARAFGDLLGATSFLALSRFATFSTAAEWWTAGFWAVQAGALGYALQQIGWAGDAAP